MYQNIDTAPENTVVMVRLFDGSEYKAYKRVSDGMAPVWCYAEGEMKNMFMPWPSEWKPLEETEGQ